MASLVLLLSAAPREVGAQDAEAEQDNAEATSSGAPEPTDLGPITSTGVRAPRGEAGTPPNAESVSRDAFLEQPGETVGDALDETSGVHVQATNRGAGAPIVRGQVGPGVVLVYDDVRFSNPTFRTGPNQALNYFDVESVDRIDVWRGSSSMLWGSDAIGGAIHLIPVRPLYARGAGARVRLGFESADTSLTFAPRLTWSDPDWAVAVSGTWNRFGELRTGGGEVATESDYRKLAGTATLGRLLSPHTELRLSWLGARIADAARPERLLSGNFRRYDDAHQMIWLHLSHDGDGAIDEVTATASLDVIQANETSHSCVRGENPQSTDSLELPDVTVDPEGCIAGDPSGSSRHTVNEDEVWMVGSSTTVRSRLPVEGLGALWGYDTYATFVGSRSRVGESPVFALEEERGQFSDDSTAGQYGAFVRGEYERAVTDDITLLPGAGVRVDHLRAFAPDVPGVGDVRYDYTGLTGGASTTVRWESGNSAPLAVAGTLAWGQGFRAPNLQETTVLGDTGDFFEIPNAGLGPERSDNFDAGLRVDTEWGSLEGSVWRLVLNDVIGRREATWDGADTVGGVPVRERYNADRALYDGWDLELRVGEVAGFSLRSRVSGVRGDFGIGEEQVPARRVPPMRWFAALRWEHALPDLYVEAVAEGAGAQDRLNPDDEKDYRICEHPDYPGVLYSGAGETCPGPEAWSTIGLRTGVQLSDRFTARLSFENLLDESYRRYGSGIDSPGFDAAISLEGRF